MKKQVIVAFAIIAALFPYLQACELINDFIPDNNVPDNNPNDTVATPFVPNQLIVIYKEQPTPESSAKVAKAIKDSIPDARLNQVCSNCDSYVELWDGTNIHTIIHGQGIASGGKGGRPVGEDTLAWYSLNFENQLPHEPYPYTNASLQAPLNETVINGTGKDTIVIAVIDTGIDTRFVKGNYLWKNKGQVVGSENPASSCYPLRIRGWDFVSNDTTIKEVNNKLHGTFVSRYIVNQFANSLINFPQIMTLKTHDANGVGTLFRNICAIHFAMDNGAHLINASWGLYYYEDQVHPYMHRLITEVLKERGILFVAAAGNKIEEVDLRAVNEDLISARDLRNLDVHRFFPAYLSTADNNVITVTTTDGNAAVSLTQNYSNQHVDLGVVADRITPGSMEFQLPFPHSGLYISGSSFATPIVTGKIGAFLPKASFHLIRDAPKQELMNVLSGIQEPNGAPLIINNNIALRHFIREGRYMDYNPPVR